MSFHKEVISLACHCLTRSWIKGDIVIHWFLFSLRGAWKNAFSLIIVGAKVVMMLSIRV